MRSKPRSKPRPSLRSRAAGAGAARCRRKFLKYFPDGFQDEKYLAWERAYKQETHERWEAALSRDAWAGLLAEKRHVEVATRAVRIESRTHLLFSFEKMALRDAVRSPAGARRFAEGLFAFVHGPGDPVDRFDAWRDVVAGLPRRQTRVLTWPVLTVFAFIARPKEHVYLKPVVTRRAAEAYGFDFEYASRPEWPTYESLLRFARLVMRDQRDLGPRDFIDAQSFLWVMGSDEYPD
jgi:hypothetical protein